MFKKKQIKLKVRRTLEQLIDVFLQSVRLGDGKPEVYKVEMLKAEYMLRGACLVLGFRDPAVQENHVTIYDSKGNMLIDR